MNRVAIYFLSFAFFALSVGAFPLREAHAGPRQVCVDNSKGQVVVKRKCKAPRFTEVTPSLLTEAQTLGGLEAGAYLRNIKVFNKTQSFQLGPFDFSGFSVSCPEGSVVTGGGASVLDNNGLRIRRSIPFTDLSGWTATVEGTKSFNSGTLSVYALCAESYIAAGY